MRSGALKELKRLSIRVINFWSECSKNFKVGFRKFAKAYTIRKYNRHPFIHLYRGSLLGSLCRRGPQLVAVVKLHEVIRSYLFYF